ncbi:MAG: alpha/beta hydrolase [Candidatus Micrarchaeaceae archaeon]|jgi:pimeloyl-ACP methyl ester carboxylesterase
MDYDKDFEDGFEYTSLGALHFKHHPGTKEKIIFLHGIGADVKVWSKLVQYLPSDLDIFLIDLLGHGESDAPHIEYTVSSQFQALREFIALQNNGDSYIFGHSYGGWIAAYYASQPCSSKGIILEDSAGSKEFFEQLSSSGKSKEYNEKLFNNVMIMNSNKDYVIRSILDFDISEDQLTTELLSDIKTKTLVLWGANDTVIDKSYGQNIAKAITSSELKVIDGAGHDPHYTNPKEVSDAIMQFMKL